MRSCVVLDCTRPFYGRGRCKLHWRRYRKHRTDELPVRTAFKCGHPRAPENTLRNKKQNGRYSVRCRVCCQTKQIDRYHTNPAAKAGAILNNRIRSHRLRAVGTFTAADWREVLYTYGRACLACGSTAPPTIDHVVPISRGGLNTKENVQPLCAWCNDSKGTKTVDYRPGVLSA